MEISLSKTRRKIPNEFTYSYVNSLLMYMKSVHTWGCDIIQSPILKAQFYYASYAFLGQAE
jgi:hypothetical protein